MNDDVAIKVDHVSKSFKLPHEKQNSIKGALIDRLRSGSKRSYEVQEVLKDISFEIKKGDFFGIVGRNGSGKSTLLKMLAGIYTPTSGSIDVRGTLTPFIELGVGFNPELTGRENVQLNGALLGFDRTEILAMYDDIVSFAELEKFMDQKLKNYSSGMQVRLAFSIAIRARSDILVLDEVLAVGDEAFQKKCNDFFNIIKKDKSRTIILVTHGMEAVRRYCNKALLLEQGEIVNIGDPNEVADDYSKQFINNTVETDQENRYGTGEIVYQHIKHTLTDDCFILEFDLVNKTKNSYDSITMGFDFFVNGEDVIGNDTRFMKQYKSGIKLGSNSKKHFTMKFQNNFGKHSFSITMNITTGLGTNVTDHIRSALSFDSNNIRFGDTWKVLTFPEIIEEEK